MIKFFTVLVYSTSIIFCFGQQISDVSFNNNELKINETDNFNYWSLVETAKINIQQSDFEPILLSCNRCICIRVYGTKNTAKAFYFTHQCKDPCQGCSRAGGLSALEWKAHYERVYSDAKSVSIVRSGTDESIKICGCNPAL